MAENKIICRTFIDGKQVDPKDLSTEFKQELNHRAIMEGLTKCGYEVTPVRRKETTT